MAGFSIEHEEEYANERGKPDQTFIIKGEKKG